jgi:hypothetical protein
MNKKSAFIVEVVLPKKMGLEMVSKSINVILVEFSF